MDFHIVKVMQLRWPRGQYPRFSRGIVGVRVPGLHKKPNRVTNTWLSTANVDQEGNVAKTTS